MISESPNVHIMEGCVLALVFTYVIELKPEIVVKLKVFSEEQIGKARITSDSLPDTGVKS